MLQHFCLGHNQLQGLNIHKIRDNGHPVDALELPELRFLTVGARASSLFLPVLQHAPSLEFVNLSCDTAFEDYAVAETFFEIGKYPVARLSVMLYYLGVFVGVRPIEYENERLL